MVLEQPPAKTHDDSLLATFLEKLERLVEAGPFCCVALSPLSGTEEVVWLGKRRITRNGELFVPSRPYPTTTPDYTTCTADLSGEKPTSAPSIDA